MARPALIGIGGHVVGAVVEHLGAVPGLAGRVELHLSPDKPDGRPPLPTAVLARAVVALAEEGAMNEAERASLGPDCAIIVLPRLEFASLWPLMAEHPPRGPDIPGVPVHFGDRIALQALRDEIPSASRRTAYDAMAVSALEDLDRLHAETAKAMFRREAGCDVRVAAFVLSCFRSERLFHSPVHPAGALMQQVMAQLLGHPALASLADGSFDAQLRAVAPGLEGVFADAQAPVHPHVAAHFALGWWSPNLRYRQGDAVRSFGEWVDWHLRGPAAAVRVVLPAGPGIAALKAGGGLAEVATLYPAMDIARAAPFFATAVDPAIAPRGAELLSTESGRYQAPAALAAGLVDAVVLGRSGAVLCGGTVLADTLPPGARPPVANLPAAHRIEGRAFLGVGPGWEADPHGMATILPRLVACARLRRQHPDLRLLLPDAADLPHLREMLALLGLEPHVAWLPDAPVACAGLVVTSRFDTDAVSPFAHGAAMALAAMVPLAPPGPRRVYLRSATSRLANEAAVAANLLARDFSVLDADATPLAERIAVLRHAGAVVATQGPALAEIAFCPPGAAVLELVGPAEPSLTYWSIASCAGLHYGYIVGEKVEPGDAHAIPLAMLDHAVGMMTVG